MSSKLLNVVKRILKVVVYILVALFVLSMLSYALIDDESLERISDIEKEAQEDADAAAKEARDLMKKMERLLEEQNKNQ